MSGLAADDDRLIMVWDRKAPPPGDTNPPRRPHSSARAGCGRLRPHALIYCICNTKSLGLVRHKVTLSPETILSDEACYAVMIIVEIPS